MTDDRREQLLAIHRFVDLVVASSRSPRQRERLNRAAALPVTASGSSLLRTIARHGPIAPGDLAGRIGLDQSTVSRQVRALEDVGLVARTPAPDDGRSSLIGLADSGRRVLERIREVAMHDYDAALEGWSDEDRATFAALLDRFRRALVDAEVDERGWSKPARPPR